MIQITLFIFLGLNFTMTDNQKKGEHSVKTEICGVRIRTLPENVWAVKGSTVEISCGVADQRSHDYIFWKKITGKDFADVISYNDWSMNTSKYSIFINNRQSTLNVQYILFIRDVDLSDEGEFECQAGNQRAKVNLTVTVPVGNMTLEWNDVKPFSPQTTVNLTCQTFHSKPPAQITWMFGVKNVSEDASYDIFYSNTTEGFGDAVSVLPIYTGGGVAGMPYKCIAQVPGQKLEDAPSLSDYVSLVHFSYSAGMPGTEVQFILMIHTTIFSVTFI